MSKNLNFKKNIYMHISKANKNKININKNRAPKRNNRNIKIKMMMINFIRKVNITSADFVIYSLFISPMILNV